MSLQIWRAPNASVSVPVVDEEPPCIDVDVLDLTGATVAEDVACPPFDEVVTREHHADVPLGVAPSREPGCTCRAVAPRGVHSGGHLWLLVVVAMAARARRAVPPAGVSLDQGGRRPVTVSSTLERPRALRPRTRQSASSISSHLTPNGVPSDEKPAM